MTGETASDIWPFINVGLHYTGLIIGCSSGSQPPNPGTRVWRRQTHKREFEKYTPSLHSLVISHWEFAIFVLEPELEYFKPSCFYMQQQLLL